MQISKKKLTRILNNCSLFCFPIFFWLNISLVSYVFAQTDNAIAVSDKSISKVNNFNNLEKRIVIKPVINKNTNSDQENISRDAMAMIKDITKSNILFEKNKSDANLSFEDQKLKDREKHNKEMKEYNERYNKKYLASLKRFQKMRGQHAGYSGVHSDYSAYLQQFLASTSR